MERPDRTSRRQLSADRAFVVHLTAEDGGRGRAEHVSSGEWAWFDSMAELDGFMRRTLETAGPLAADEA